METLQISLDHARLMIGLQGQQLGLVRRAELDLESGALINLKLETSWQQIDIPWHRVRFQSDDDTFHLTPLLHRKGVSQSR